MDSLTYGTLPEEVDFFIAAPEKYNMSLVGRDADITTRLINQGIDSHLDMIRFTYSYTDKLNIKFSDKKSLYVFLRRAIESEKEEALDLASGILFTLGWEWI